MNKTKIEYGDYGWNPIRGCKGIGCAVKDKCWAKSMNKRFHYIKDWNTPEIDYETLDDPDMSKKVPGRVLTCFMSDIFGEGVKPFWRNEMYTIMKLNPQHNYFTLTKHPERLGRNEHLAFPGNAWFGVTINQRKNFEKMNNANLLICGAKYWISFEPLLSHIEIPYYARDFKWFVIGGMQKGREPRPKKEWIENIVRYAADYNIPVFMKDNLKNVWADKLIQEFPK